MKKILALVLFLLFIILAWCSWQWYKDTMLCCNGSELVEPKENVVQPATVKYGPLVYNWNSDKATINDLWPSKKQEILSALADGKILRIVGPYFKDEINKTTFDNLGLARAHAVKELLKDSIPNEQMETDSKLVDQFDEAKTKPFGGTILDWVVRNENIKEIDNKVLIYFPYNSSTKLENENINKYLTSVAEVLKGNDKTVTLTGHTDNSGRTKYNKWLGLKRAKTTKKILVKLGVASKRIIVASKGETEPIADNATKEGQQKNRRVELEIK